MNDICRDCIRAESELWPVYTVTAWCCRARHIVDATTSRVVRQETLDDVRRALSVRERERYPADWERVRARLVALKASSDARDGTERASPSVSMAEGSHMPSQRPNNRGQIK